jgi:hypothetical protein
MPACRCYFSQVKLDPQRQAEYITLNRSKLVVYERFLYNQYNSISAGGNFSQLVQSGIKNPNSVLIIPFISSTCGSKVTAGALAGPNFGFNQYGSTYHWEDLKRGHEMMLGSSFENDDDAKALHNTNLIGALTQTAVIALISYFIMRNRKLQQNSIKKLEEMDAKALLVASAVDDGVLSFAEDLCKDAQTRTSSSEFRAAMMKAAQKHGVTLKYRHFFKPDGSLRNEKDVCTMLKAVPPLRASKTKSHTRKSSKHHHRGGRWKGSRRSV